MIEPAMKANAELTIIIPCYNEAENLPHVLPGIIRFCEDMNFRLIVVDDGSKDNTYSLLTALRSDCLEICRHSRNRGYGAAIKTGIRNCQTSYCVTIDADGQHDLGDIQALREAMAKEHADLVIGNRQGMGSSVVRNVGKRLILWFTRIFLKLPVRDLNSGMKLYKTNIVQSLLPFTPNSMAFSDVVTLVHFQLRYKIVERNITVSPRSRGRSTINWRTAVQTLSEIAFLVVNFFPFKVFSLLAFLFFLAGAAWGIPFVLSGKGVTVGSALLLLTSLVIFLQGIMIELLVRMRYQTYVHPNDAAEDDGESI